MRRWMIRFKNHVRAVGTNDKVFNDAAMTAIQEWRYAPRLEDGNPVDTNNVLARMTFSFAE